MKKLVLPIVGALVLEILVWMAYYFQFIKPLKLAIVISVAVGFLAAMIIATRWIEQR